jgi:rubrerythrin
MNEFKSITDVLDFAIASEQTAIDFYEKLAENASSDAMKSVFLNFADEEKGHKHKLQNIKESGQISISNEKVVSDLKILDYVVEKEVTENMSYEDALILAMKREKAAFRLYTKLASMSTNASYKNLFLDLAQEEAKHKLRFEIEYDERVLREN